MSRFFQKFLAAALVLAPLAAARAAAPATLDEIKPTLEHLGVTLQVTQRPAWPKVTVSSVKANLVPQMDLTGATVVSFGLPFPPDSLTNDKNIRVTDANGTEIPVFTRPLVKWWIDRKEGAIRSVLIQFEATFQGKTPQSVTITWDKPRTKNRPTEVASVDTQFKRHVDPPANFKTADPYDYQCPKVLALLPADWLCNSLVAWQQITVANNKVYPWFDEHYTKMFPGSLPNISANPAGFEAHLFDRPAVYAKFYVRSGDEKQLAAALAANDYYRQHITPDGFFDVKKERNGQPAKDLKYVYSEGTAIMYMLTGDENYKETLKRVAKGWATHRPIEYTGKENFWTERHHGFGMMAWDHLYELTGDTQYLDNAKRFFNAVLDMQVNPKDGKAPDGAWVHSASAHGDGEGYTTSPWMSCFLTDAIWKYWMLSGDNRAAASLAMYDKFSAKWAVTPDGKYMMYMANSPGRGAPENNDDVAHNTEGIYLMSMGYYLSGGTDKDYLVKIEGLKPGLLNDGANRPGRKFNWRFRETSMGLWFLSNASKPLVERSLSPSEQARMNLQEQTDTTLQKAQSSDPGLKNMMDAAAGYAVFPAIGKGPSGVGGASGYGVLYQGGKPVGYCKVGQATIGFQLGGQSYGEIICFEAPDALNKFKSGNFAFGAEAVAVALKSGVAAKSKYASGVAVFTLSEAGLMYEASVGGQKFEYTPM